MKFIKNGESGSALATAMGLIGVIALGIMATFNVLEHKHKFFAITNIQTSMLSLHKKLEQAGANMYFYKYTTVGGADDDTKQHLIDCFNPDKTKRVCLDMAADEWKNVTSKYVLFTDTPNANGKYWKTFGLSGLFDSNGRLCKKTDCTNGPPAFKATTEYRLDCDKNKDECKYPSLIELRWTITHMDKTLTGGYQIPTIQGKAASSAKICPPGEYMKGITSSGTLDCRPLTTNRAQMCPPKEYVWKITSNGSIKCRKKEDLCQNLCVALVLDTSGSMKGDLAATKTYAKKFLDRFGTNTSGSSVTDKVALINFSTSANVPQTLTSNMDSVKNAVDRLVANGSTNFQAGLDQAGLQLDNCPAGSSLVTVFMSDGRNNRGQRPANTKKLKNKPSDMDPGLGVKLFSIAMGPNADKDSLKRLSGKEKDNFFVGSNVTALSTIFTNISTRICRN